MATRHFRLLLHPVYEPFCGAGLSGFAQVVDVDDILTSKHTNIHPSIVCIAYHIMAHLDQSPTCNRQRSPAAVPSEICRDIQKHGFPRLTWLGGRVLEPT